ncbi:hypothetical protein DY023_02790 [Microbacterium bovistercoris]|uniref:Glycosyltransferase n=1 Tax=Microbacterium bovistercoris TaxID=2293570 RepID=A0A371NWN0_9MICO|nr:hypothetical protein [Microbacterium bovistercoris]REJ07585.1 hypothetical protein DY023_02790 [Microbacterium bovistercoris]
MSSERSFKQRVVAQMPDPIAERLLPWKRASFRAAGTASVPRAERRLLIGPVNSAGQAHAWAQAASRIPETAAMNVMFRADEDLFSFPADQSVSTAYAITNVRWQRAQRRAVVRRFSHVLIESGRRLFGPGIGVREDIGDLALHDVHVGLLWHGSDIRLPSVHARMDPDSPFLSGTYPDQAQLERIAARNHELIAATGLPNFVSTPDLLAFVPHASWLPVVVDHRRWSSAAGGAVLERERPVVVHAPSRAGLKGTALIAGLLRRMDAEGVIDYREVVGIPAVEMPRVYGDADIVLDQFSLGIYGVAACEAMAGGRVVVSHVSDQVRATVGAVTGHELPVVEARAADLERVLRAILDDREQARAVAARGPAFVADVHDGRRARDVLAPFLGVGVPPPVGESTRVH